MIKRNILAGAVIGAAMTAVAATASFAQGASGGDRLLDVIVVMDEATAPGGHGANRAAAANFARGLGVNPRHAYGTVLFGFAASVPEALMDALENNPRVDYIELDRTAFASAPKWCNDPANGDLPGCGGGGAEDPAPTGQVTPWGILQVGADVAHSTGLGNTGSGVDVYVLDTGIDIDHPDLTNVISRVDCTGNGGCVVDPGEADDKNGHGTHVAGTIAALDNDIGVIGMAPDATLHAVQVLGNSGRGSYSGIIAGIDWVATQPRPSVINMSLGGSGGKNADCDGGTGELVGGTDAFHQAICRATFKGVVVVVAAGNSGADAANHVPAAYDDTVITVSATNDADNWPSFSNWGDDTANLDGLDVTSAPVAIAAPGVSVLSTWKGGSTNTISGTSMASPHVAGAVALWLASNALVEPNFDTFTSARAALYLAGTLGGISLGGDPHDEPVLDVSSFIIPLPR